MDENILSFVFDVDRSCFFLCFFFDVGTFDECTKCGGGSGGGGGCEVMDNVTTHAKERRHLAFQCLLLYTHVCPKRTFNPGWHVFLSHAARKKKNGISPPTGGQRDGWRKLSAPFILGFALI